MNANRFVRVLLNIVAGLMLLAAAGGSAQAMAPAQALPVAALHDTIVGTDDVAAPAKVEKAYYYRRYYFRRYYRPRYFYRPRYYYRPRYFYRPRFFF